MLIRRKLLLLFVVQYIVKGVFGGNCSSDDESRWKEEIYPLFPSKIQKCAVKGLSVDSITRQCLKDELRMSDGCTECGVDVVNCMARLCISACVDTTAIEAQNFFKKDCLQCLGGQNREGFSCIAEASECTGFSEGFIFNCKECRQPGELTDEQKALYGGIGAAAGVILFCCLASVVICRNKHNSHEDVPGDLIITNPTGKNHGFKFPNMFFIPAGPSASNQVMMDLKPIQPPPGLWLPNQTNPAAAKSSNSMLSNESSSGGYFPVNPPSVLNGLDPVNAMILSPVTNASPVVAVAKFDFKGVNSDELNVIKGSLLKVKAINNDWWQCEDVATGKLGLIPASYCDLAPLSPIPEISTPFSLS